MRQADDGESTDPGLARERTELAWTRTAISFAALGGAILRNHPLAGVPVLLLGVVVWRLGQLPSATAAGSARQRRLVLITTIVTGIALAALILTFV